MDIPEGLHTRDTDPRMGAIPLRREDALRREGFDTASPGTPESAWHACLSRAPFWSPRQGPLVIVAPHPDDETLGCGGLIHAWVRRGLAVTVLSVTDGEKSHPECCDLAALRRRELDAALHVLGGDAVSVRRLGLPDGGVGEHAGRLQSALAALLQAKATLLAPYERDGHGDHDAAGRVCVEAARAHGVSIARYPVWAWHQSRPGALAGARWGRFELDPGARLAKQRAMRCFASQLCAEARPAVLPDHVVRYFTRPYEAFLL